jgi:hypothetical protein
MGLFEQYAFHFIPTNWLSTMNVSSSFQLIVWIYEEMDQNIRYAKITSRFFLIKYKAPARRAFAIRLEPAALPP